MEAWQMDYKKVFKGEQELRSKISDAIREVKTWIGDTRYDNSIKRAAEEAMSALVGALKATDILIGISVAEGNGEMTYLAGDLKKNKERISMKNVEKIVDRVAKGITGAGKWGWEIFEVNKTGALLQLGYDGLRFIKLGELTKITNEMTGKARSDLANLAKELPINTAKIEIGEIEVASEDNKITIFVNVTVKWLPGDHNMVWEDVHEAIRDAGLLR
jgi:hypothetical protein